MAQSQGLPSRGAVIRISELTLRMAGRDQSAQPFKRFWQIAKISSVRLDRSR